MATVIDALVVQLGLDAKSLTRDEKRAVTSLGRIDKSVKGVDINIGKIGHTATDAFSKARNQAVAFLAVLTAGRGLKDFVSSTTKANVAAGNMARNIGTSVNSLTTWQKAAESTGASADDVSSSLGSLVSQFQTVEGRQNLAQTFGLLHVNLTKANGQMREMDDLIPDLARSAKALGPQQFSAIASQAGFSQGFINFLEQGPEKVRRLYDSLKKYAPNAEDAKASAQLYEQWIKLTAQSEKFGRSLMTDLSPEMHELMSFISDAVDKRADRWLANIKYETDQFGRALKQIDWRGIGNDLKAWEEYLKSIDWHSVSENVKQFASGADTAAKAVGGWKDVVGALFDLWASAKFFQVLGNVRMLAAASSATSSGSIAGASALLGAGMFATQAGYEAYKEIKYDASDEGRLANRRDIFARKDPYYSGNRYSALEQNQIQHALFGYGVGTLHRDPKDVAAMLAMFKAESGFNTEAIADNGDSFGLAQWHYDRQKWIEQMAGKRLSAMTPQEQMKWAFAERDERYRDVSSQVAKDSTPTQMAAHLTAGYEIPKDVDGESIKRGILASRIYANETGSTGSAFTDVLANLRASQAAMHTASSITNNQGGDTNITVPVSVSVTAPPGSNPHATGRAVADAIHEKFSNPQILARMASRGVQ